MKLKLLGILVILLALFFTTTRQVPSFMNKSTYVIAGDAEGYYLYLPAWFLSGGYGGVQPISAQIPRVPETGNVFSKYTCGVALMELPFFLATTAIVKATGRVARPDGYSSHYSYALNFAAAFYTLFGLVLLFTVLSCYFGTFPTLVALATILWGTNLHYYMVVEPGHSHVYSFFLFCLIIYAAHGRDQRRNVWIGWLALALATFIRPTNAIMVFYLLFAWRWAGGSPRQLRKTIVDERLPILGAAILFLVLMTFQVLQWREMSGGPMFYSYTGEGFVYWYRPKLFRVLFDVQNGFFIYAPAMLLGVVGMWLGRHNKYVHSALTGIILTIATYIFASWWAWWFGGAYGHRCYVEYLALLSFSIAFLTRWIIDRKRNLVLVGYFTLIAFLIYYSIGMARAYEAPWDGPEWTWSAYLNVLATLF